MKGRDFKGPNGQTQPLYIKLKSQPFIYHVSLEERSLRTYKYG